MKLTDYIAEFLSKEVKHAFNGQGGVVIHLNDSIQKHSDITLVPCENEQGASIAAEAYARVNRNLGVAIATSGPGMINLMQGIACAYYDSIPTLYISGEAPVSHLKGRQKVRQMGFQEMNVTDIVRTLTKYAVLVEDPKRIRYELEKLVYYAKEGRPGPVMLDLPDDLQRADICPDELESFIPPKKKECQNITECISEMQAMIESAERPVIIAGGGIKLSKTIDSAKLFIEKTGIPVLTTWATIDLFRDDDPNLIGNFGISASRFGNFAVQTADLLISIGSRLDTHETGSNASAFAVNSKKIMIDVDEEELNKKNGLDIDLKIHCDLRDFFESIKDIAINTKDISSWKERIKEWKKKYPVCEPEYYAQKDYVNPYVFMNELSKESKDGDIIITDAGGTLTWTMQAYKAQHEQMLFSAFNHSPMGYALPASIGAQFAASEKDVICITGDGGMNMNIQELETIIYNKLPIKIFVLNNGEYGIIKQTQDTWMDSHYVGTDNGSGLGFPDLVKIAEAYGYEIVEINNHSELNSTLQKVLSCKNKAIFCNVKVKSGQQIVPKLVFGRPLEDLAPLLSKEELESNLNF